MADIDAFRDQALLHEIAEAIRAETAEIARLRAAAARLDGDVDGVAAGILHALGQIDIDGVVADAEEGDHQYSVFHIYRRVLSGWLCHTASRSEMRRSADCTT